MTDENNDQAQESRIKVEDLPQAAEELTDEEAKDVKGGLNFAGKHLKIADGSVTPQESQAEERLSPTLSPTLKTP